MIRRTITTLSICGFAAATLAAPVAAMPVDNRSTVCDLQTLIAALTTSSTEESTPAISDLNGDGLVDVLDFQLLLRSLLETETNEDTSNEPPSDQAVAPHRVQPSIAHCSVLVSEVRESDTSAYQARSDGSPSTIFPPRLRRLLFGLTSNAPPCAL